MAICAVCTKYYLHYVPIAPSSHREFGQCAPVPTAKMTGVRWRKLCAPPTPPPPNRRAPGAVGRRPPPLPGRVAECTFRQREEPEREKAVRNPRINSLTEVCDGKGKETTVCALGLSSSSLQGRHSDGGATASSLGLRYGSLLRANDRRFRVCPPISKVYIGLIQRNSAGSGLGMACRAAYLSRDEPLFCQTQTKWLR